MEASMSDYNNPHAKPVTDGSEFVAVKAIVGENVYLLQGEDAQITLSHAEAAQMCVDLYGLLHPAKIPALKGNQ